MGSGAGAGASTGWGLAIWGSCPRAPRCWAARPPPGAPGRAHLGLERGHGTGPSSRQAAARRAARRRGRRRRWRRGRALPVGRPLPTSQLLDGLDGDWGAGASWTASRSPAPAPTPHAPLQRPGHAAPHRRLPLHSAANRAASASAARRFAPPRPSKQRRPRRLGFFIALPLRSSTPWSRAARRSWRPRAPSSSSSSTPPPPQMTATPYWPSNPSMRATTPSALRLRARSGPPRRSRRRPPGPSSLITAPARRAVSLMYRRRHQPCWHRRPATLPQLTRHHHQARPASTAPPLPACVAALLPGYHVNNIDVSPVP